MKEFIEQLENLNASAPVDVPETEPTLSDGHSPEPAQMPLRPASSEEVSEAWKPDAHELRLFARTGLHLHDPGILKASHRGFWPAFLHSFRTLTRYRQPWPVFMESSEQGVHLCSLTTWIDDLDPSGENSASTSRLESHLRLASAERAVAPWSSIQASAPADLDVPDTTHASAWLLSPTPEALSLLWGHVVAAVNTARRQSLLEEVNELSARLADLIRVEEEDSDKGHDPDRLQHAMGGAFLDTIDFGSLSNLMEEAPHAAPSDDVRLKRIRSVLDDLARIPEALYDRDILTKPARTPDEAISRLHEQVDRFTRLLRAIQISRLELENRYRADLHDAVFEAFSYQAIPDSERRAFPPVAVHLSLREDDDPEPLLLALREPGMMRVLLTSSDVYNERAEHHPMVDAARRLVADADTFVQQTTVSHVNFLLEGFTLAARAQGNALISVALGRSADPASIEAYLAAGVLSESRIFPSFRFDPEHGPEWADWMDVADNESPSTDWVDHNVPTKEPSAGLPDCFLLTPADFLFLDGRFGDQFHLLDPDMASDGLIDVAEWTRLDATQRQVRIPFIWLSTPEGALARAVVSPMITRAVSQSAARWRVLQEWAGVNASLVRRQLEAERELMEKERDAAIEEARASFEARMEANTELLARQIVENIAASLLDGKGSLPLNDAGARTAMASAAAKATQAPPTEVPPESVESTEESAEPDIEEEPEPKLSLDEAYIDTPLCTSCNECTDRNGLIFAYDENKQAYIKDVSAGPFRDIVMAAEKCPVRIIHPGKPLDPDESDLDEWIERAQPFQ